VSIGAADSAGRERLRYCARLPFALVERLRELDPERLLYTGAKLGPGGNGPLLPTNMELLDRLAALVPPPRTHRSRYFGVLASTAAHWKCPRRRRMTGAGRFKPATFDAANSGNGNAAAVRLAQSYAGTRRKPATQVSRMPSLAVLLDHLVGT